MSKVVTIPCCMSPFTVTINGVPYTYAAGSVVEVPDEVAAVIENHMNQHKEPEQEEKLTAKVGQTVVVAEVDEDGRPTKWQAADLPAGNNGGPEFYEVNFTQGGSQDTPSGSVNVFISDKSGEEVRAAIMAGKIVVAKLPFPDSGGYEDTAAVYVGGDCTVEGPPEVTIGKLYWDYSFDEYTWIK